MPQPNLLLWVVGIVYFGLSNALVISGTNVSEISLHFMTIWDKYYDSLSQVLFLRSKRGSFVLKVAVNLV